MIREDLMERAAPALHIEHVRDAIGFQALRVPWLRLWSHAGENPFLTWNWMQAFWAHVEPGRRPLILAARTAGGELVGVLPLSIERQGIARVCRFLADDTVGSDYLDALVDPELDGSVRRALWSEALRLADRAYDILELREMLHDGPGATLVRELQVGAGLELETEPRYRCPRIEIRGAFADFIKNVSRADNLKRRKKQLEKMPGFAVDVARREDEIGPALETFFRLHRLRWEADGGSQGITNPRIEAFHRDVVRRFAREGEVRLYTLRLAEKPIASVYMLGKGATRYFYQSGYDPAHAKQSPGLVLLARTIEDAFDEGARFYDFLHGSEPYKFEWATGERQTMALRLTVPNLRGKWRTAERSAVAAARALGQKWLGENYELLRRLRRKWAFA